MTTDFESDVKRLNNLLLSEKEQEAIHALEISRKIYLTGSHHLRVQLMKSNLLKEYAQFKNSKNLFKYGGGHLAKGESFLEIYDIGNLINNISDSQFEKPLHILVIGESGMQGVPFKGIPNQKIDIESNDLKSYHSFFNAMNESEDWHLFDLNAICEELKKENIQIENKALQRIIKGYDFLVIIPTVTAVKFIN